MQKCSTLFFSVKDCMQAAGLVNLLDSTTSAITVFAPTDDALAALASALSLTSEELLSKSDLLSVVRREFKATDVL